MEITDREVERIADYLQGSCSDLGTALSHVNDDREQEGDPIIDGDFLDVCTSRQLEMFDELTYCCPNCGWWNHDGIGATTEINGELVCYDCADEYENEEDE